MTTKTSNSPADVFTEEQALAWAEMHAVARESFNLLSVGWSEENTKRVEQAIVVRRASAFAELLDKKIRDDAESEDLETLVRIVNELPELLPRVIKTDLKPVQGQGSGMKNVTDFALEYQPHHKIMVRLTRPEVL